MTPEELKAEIEAGPLASDFADDWTAGNTGVVATRLNAKGFGTILWGILWPDLVLWSAGNGVRQKIEAAATGQLTSPDVPSLASYALAFLDHIRGPLGTERRWLDFTNPRITGATVGGVYQPGMLDGMVAGGVITADQRTELMTMGTFSASRYEVLTGRLGDKLTISEVDAARSLG